MILLPLALLAIQAAPSLPASPDPMPPRRNRPEAAAPAPPPPAPQADDPASARYRQCTDQIRANAEAAVAAGDGRKALAALDAALLSPNLTDELRGEVHLDRARARVAMADNDGARTELDRAAQLVPNDPFAWYLSAALARRVNDLPRAAADIAHARQLAPDSPDVLLLAGTIAGLQGNMAEAERLYRQVATAAPNSDAGRQAQESLATMREVEAPAATPTPQAPH